MTTTAKKVTNVSTENFLTAATEARVEIIATLSVDQGMKLAEELGDAGVFFGLDLIQMFQVLGKPFFKTDGFLGFIAYSMIVKPETSGGESWEELFRSIEPDHRVLNCLDTTKLAKITGVSLDSLIVDEKGNVTVYIAAYNEELDEMELGLEWYVRPYIPTAMVMENRYLDKVVSASVCRNDIIFMDTFGKVFVAPCLDDETWEIQPNACNHQIEVTRNDICCHG